MPLDVLQQIDKVRQNLAASGTIQELIDSLDQIKEKASGSSEKLSVLNSIISSMTSNGRTLHDCIGDVVRDFKTYDHYIAQATKATTRYSSGLESLDTDGVKGIKHVNQNLSASLSLLQTVEREIRKYKTLLAAPAMMSLPLVPAVPIQKFAHGGKIRGTSKTGDRNLALVNAGEWVFTERQMDNLKRITGARSHSEVFRMAGGIPGHKDFDSSGILKFSRGGTYQRIDTEIASLKVKQGNPSTSAADAKKFDSSIKSLERLNRLIQTLSDKDFDTTHIEKDIKKIFSRIASGTKDVSSSVDSMTRSVSKLTAKYSGDALKFAVDLQDANKRVQNANTPAAKKNAEHDVAFNSTMLSLSQQKYLTSAQEAQRKDIAGRAKKATTFSQKEAITQEGQDLIDGNNLDRPVTFLDSIKIGIEKESDAKLESVKEFLGGTPKGATAVAAAIGLAAKEAAEFVNKMAGGVEATAKLSIENTRLGKSFDSTFGNGSYETFRNDMNLTRQEMTELAPVITDAYRSAGVELDHISEVAENITAQFGTMDPGTLQEALGVMKELTGDQTKILLTGNGSSQDRSNMYANLMESGKAGQAADLLEQGVFGGDNLSANISDADREIVKELQFIRKTEENVNMGIKSGFGMFHQAIPLAKGISAVISVGGMALQGLTTLRTIQLLLSQRNTTGGIASGGGIKGAAGTLAAMAVTELFVTGFNSIQDYFEKKVRVKEAKKDKAINDTYQETGFNTSEADLNIDWDAVTARGAKYGAWGAGIGGTIGGTIGVLAGGPTVVGNIAGGAVGAAVGASIGGHAGYELGSQLEINEQLGDKVNNPFLMLAGQDGVHNKELLKAISKTNGYVQQIKKYNEDNRRSEIKSLRLIESTDIVVKKVKSGAYTKFNDRMVETSRNNINAMALTGGNDAGYDANVSTILDNSTTSFVKNMDVLSAKQRNIAEQDGITAESRINATQAVLNEQASITKKFVEAVYDSIGNYDKIPSVIQNSLKSKIASMTLDFNTSNMVGTSSMATETLSENLQRSGENAAAALEQYQAEFPKTQAAVKAAEQKLAEGTKNYKTQAQAGDFSSLGIGEVVTQDGKVNGQALKEGLAAVKTQNEQLDQEIKNKTGISNYDYTDAKFTELKAGNKTWSDLEGRVKEMDEEKWETEGSETLTQMRDAMQSDIERLQSIMNDDKIDKKYRDDASTSYAAIKEAKLQLDMMHAKAEKNKKLPSLKSVKNIRGLFSAGTQTPSSHFDTDRQAVENNSQFKARREQLGKAESALTAVSGVHNAQTAALKNMDKMQAKLIDAAKKVQADANALIGQFENDPMIRFYQAQASNLEAQKDYLLSTGNYADYLSGRLKNINHQMQQLKDTTANIKKEYTKQKETYQKNIQNVISESENDPLVLDFVRRLNELSELQLKAHNDPKLNKQVAEKAKEVDAEKKKLPGSSKDKAELLILQLTALNGTAFKIQEQENKTKSAQFAQFKQMLSLMGGYKESIDYMAVNSVKGQIHAQTELASANLDVNAASRLSEQARTANTEQYRQNIEGIETERKSNLAKLDAAEINATPEEKEAIAKERAIIENDAVKKTAETQLEYQRAQTDAARMEYDIKMKTVDLATRQFDIQSDLAQSIGAPMETIMALERQRVQKAQEAYEIAEKQFHTLEASGTNQEAIEEAKLKMQEAQAKVIKNQLGAQRSMMEKIFGNMIGSFSEVAGIMGPNNIAAKYGMGYMQGPDGSVAKGGAPSGGYRDRLASANKASGKTAITGGTPSRKKTGNTNGTESAPGKTAKTERGAVGKSNGDAEFGKLGETFKSEKEGIEMVVFWEKKIYNLLYDNLASKPLFGGNNAGTAGKNGAAASPGFYDSNSKKQNGMQGKSIPYIPGTEPKTSALALFPSGIQKIMNPFHSGIGAGLLSTPLYGPLISNLPAAGTVPSPVSSAKKKKRSREWGMIDGKIISNKTGRFVGDGSALSELEKKSLEEWKAERAAKIEKENIRKRNREEALRAKRENGGFGRIHGKYVDEKGNALPEEMQTKIAMKKLPSAIKNLLPSNTLSSLAHIYPGLPQPAFSMPLPSTPAEDKPLTADVSNSQAPVNVPEALKKFTTPAGWVKSPDDMLKKYLIKIPKSVFEMTPEQLAEWDKKKNQNAESAPQQSWLSRKIDWINEKTGINKLMGVDEAEAQSNRLDLQRRLLQKYLRPNINPPATPIAETAVMTGSVSSSNTKDEGAKQQIAVEVQVKFNNDMFEEQIKRVVVTPSVSKNIVTAGIGKRP